jgi:hypothetical protein
MAQGLAKGPPAKPSQRAPGQHSPPRVANGPIGATHHVPTDALVSAPRDCLPLYSLPVGQSRSQVRFFPLPSLRHLFARSAGDAPLPGTAAPERHATPDPEGAASSSHHRASRRGGTMPPAFPPSWGPRCRRPPLATVWAGRHLPGAPPERHTPL